MDQKTRLDVHRIGGVYVGIFREPFERVLLLQGFVLRPAGEQAWLWEYKNTDSGERGRLLDVAAYLGEAHVALSSKGVAYTTTRQGHPVALLFPGAPRRMRLNRDKYKVLHGEDQPAVPDEWASDLILRVIQHRFRKIVILDEKHLLSTVGLRTGSSTAGAL